MIERVTTPAGLVRTLASEGPVPSISELTALRRWFARGTYSTNADVGSFRCVSPALVLERTSRGFDVRAETAAGLLVLRDVHAHVRSALGAAADTDVVLFSDRVRIADAPGVRADGASRRIALVLTETLGVPVLAPSRGASFAVGQVPDSFRVGSSSRFTVDFAVRGLDSYAARIRRAGAEGFASASGRVDDDVGRGRAIA